MKKTVNAFDYAGKICQSMKKGILLTTAKDGQVNTMTIGWGTIGIEWSKPVFVAYVRDSRYTRQLLDATGEFTVNIPMGEVDPKILAYCGTKSGAQVDKIRDMNLHLEKSDVISVPGIRELPLTLECKVLFRNEQDERRLSDAIRDRYYSAGNAQDFHIAYYGEIVNAYLITE